MLAVQVELLTGRYVATRFNDRDRAEWPPHPARVFSAAVAAWADADEPDERERAALRWWEQQGDPSVTCSWGDDECSERTAVTHYVPVNDVQLLRGDAFATTYERLRLAIEAVESAQDGDTRALAKATQVLAKAQAKATDDSSKASVRCDAPASALAILPDERGRQPRIYPTAVPVDDRVVYRWPRGDSESPHVAVLDSLLARVARIGHSSSFVAVSVVSTDVADTLVPHEHGGVPLRVASPGQLDALEAAFATHRGTEPRVLPALMVQYREAGQPRVEVPGSHFGEDWLLLEMDGPARPMVRDALAVARAVRGALLAYADQDPVPEILSGHRIGSNPPTGPTARPHLAVVPLPFIGHPHADGRIRSVGLVIPTPVGNPERDQVQRALRRWLEAGGEIRLGPRGTADVALLEIVDAPISAQPNRWCQPSARWMTATPIALDRNPGDLRHRDAGRRRDAEHKAEEIVAAACTFIGLPAPIRVAIHHDPLVHGSAPVGSFPKYAVQNGRLQRVLVHAAIEFDVVVRGPVLLGAGRYLGYGLCLPTDHEHREARHD